MSENIRNGMFNFNQKNGQNIIGNATYDATKYQSRNLSLNR